jgi:hypothetical protein
MGMWLSKWSSNSSFSSDWSKLKQEVYVLAPKSLACLMILRLKQLIPNKYNQQQKLIRLKNLLQQG